MAGKSWEFTGEERGWHNFWDHRFIRSALVPGWSATEGGPGPSSHNREEETKTYLQRPCVTTTQVKGGVVEGSNGGPQLANDNDKHRDNAARTLRNVDIARRIEFHRRQEVASIKERISKAQLADQVKHNLGYPFNQGLLSREVKLKEVEKTDDERFMEQLHPNIRETDFQKKWDRTPLGQIVWKSEENAAKASLQKDEHFHQWLGPIGWQDGYFELRSGAPASSKGEVKPETDLVVSDVSGHGDAADAKGAGGEEGSAVKEDATDETAGQDKAKQTEEEPEASADKGGTKCVWHGPEDDPRWLDVFIWKPLNAVGPATITAAGATKTVNNLMMGLEKATPQANLPKRNYVREMTSKHHIKHTNLTVKYRDNVLAEQNIETTDWLTGATVYKFDQRAQTRTAFATLDKKEMINRKEVKQERLEKAIADLHKQILEQKNIITKVEAKVLHKENGKNKPKMLVHTGRTHIKEAEEKIAQLERQVGLLRIRLDQEQREIKALQYEVQVKHTARDLPLPNSLVMLMNPKDLESMAELNYTTLNTVRKAIGVPELREDPDAFIENESDDDDGSFNLIKTLFNGGKEDGEGKKVEKYFGQPLINSATGMLNLPVVKRKNADIVMKSQEENKATADVFFARTDGRPAHARPDLKQKKEERRARAKQQKAVDGLMAEVCCLEGEENKEVPTLRLFQEGVARDCAMRVCLDSVPSERVILKMDPLQDLEAWAKSPTRGHGTFGSSLYPASAKAEMQTFKIDNGQYLNYRALVKGTNTGNKTGGQCSSGKVVGALNHTLIEKGQNFALNNTLINKGEAMKSSLAVQVTGAKGPFETTFHTGYQNPEDKNAYELRNWGPERGDQWAIGKSFADTYGRQCCSAASGVTANVSFAGAFVRSDKLPDNHIASASHTVQGPFRETLVEDRPFNGQVKKKN